MNKTAARLDRVQKEGTLHARRHPSLPSLPAMGTSTCCWDLLRSEPKLADKTGNTLDKVASRFSAIDSDTRRARVAKKAAAAIERRRNARPVNAAEALRSQSSQRALDSAIRRKGQELADVKELFSAADTPEEKEA